MKKSGDGGDQKGTDHGEAEVSKEVDSYREIKDPRSG